MNLPGGGAYYGKERFHPTLWDFLAGAATDEERKGFDTGATGGAPGRDTILGFQVRTWRTPAGSDGTSRLLSGAGSPSLGVCPAGGNGSCREGVKVKRQYALVSVCP